MTPLALVHVLAAVVALLAGAAVLLRPKGGARHRRLGKAYFASMLVLNGTALAIYRLFGGFGPFHVAAISSLATVVPGVVSARRKRPGWQFRHYYWMTFSYVGLLAAAASEALTRFPEAPFWSSVLLASASIIVVGGVFIVRRASATLAPFLRSP